MKTIIVTGSEAAISLIRTLAVASEMYLQERLEVITPADDSTITIKAAERVKIGASPFLHHGPRVHYKAVNVDDAPQALTALGEHTVMGLIFSHIVGGTVSGERITSKSLREKTKFNTKTIESRVNDLRSAKLVVSEAIPLEERL